MTRRELLQSAAAASVATAAEAAATGFDFASALEAANAIRTKKVSSTELTRRMFERIDRYQPQLNAFVYQMREQALAQARRADEAIARHEPLGAFHGVPFAVKESFGVKGEPDTWGIPQFKDARAEKNSAVVDHLLGAGAVLTGGTNVPVNLQDWQTYNPIYGTTNNPWDVKRTPGGSSGGSAAALAAGLTYLSVGSDIGGSLRVPAHFCGIYAHKPTLDLVSLRGHLPGGAQEAPGFSTLLAVAGPIARSARDLHAGLKVIGGPDGWAAKAWSWKMPAARKRALKDFRVGFVVDDPSARPTSDMKPVLDRALTALGRAGAQLHPGWPAGFHLPELLDNYLVLLFAFFYATAPKAAQETLLAQYPAETPPGRGLRASHAEWQDQDFRRLGFRKQWQDYFANIDVFLTPVAFTPAFAHDHSPNMGARVIDTADGKRPYMEMLNWIATPTLTGCPATAAPIGRTAAGLPVGLQIMGPYWEDATPIEFAALLADEIGGFEAPPGYRP